MGSTELAGGAGLAVGLTAGLGGAVLFGVAAVVQAHAVRRRPGALGGLRAFVTHGVRNPLLLGVVAAYLVGFVLHAVAIWMLPLYLAQASVSLSLPVTALASRRLSEGLGRREWLGVAAVSAGLVLLAAGSGRPGDTVATWVLPGALAVVLVGLLLCGSLLDLDGGTLGWLAGLGYAGSALAVRGVAWPVGATSVWSAVLVPMLGLVAFWLYSLGLHRRLVTASTAPLITTQTFVPAIVGLVWLGDGVRPGWGPAVAVGLVLAVLGSGVVVQDHPGARGV